MWVKRLVRYDVYACTLFLLLSVLAVVTLRWVNPTTTAFMLADTSSRQPILHYWVDWDDISSAAPLAVVASEDQKFAEHFGFDLTSIQSSLEEREQGGRLRGASTITQQVAKNLFLWGGRSYIRKGLEAYATVLIELAWPKKRILEVYLNIAEFGPGIYGVHAASTEFFNTSPALITPSDAALLAAVLPNPKRLHAERPSTYVLERQRWILSQMQRLQQEQWLMLLD